MKYEVLMVISGFIKAASNERGIRSESCKKHLNAQDNRPLTYVAIQPAPATLPVTKERKRYEETLPLIS